MPDNARRILVLEDNPVQSALYEKILRAGGFEPLMIVNPLDLVDNLRGICPPDAILLDIVMPGMDGVTVLQHLELDSLWCSIPVVLMTSSPTKDRVVAANQLPVPPEGFLAKPVEPQVMLQLLRAVIAGLEPIYLLRHFQRQRLSLKLGLRGTLDGLAVAIRENKESQAHARKALAESRREIQSLQSARSMLEDAPPETTRNLVLQIQVLEEACLRHRAVIQEADAQHHYIIRQRQEVLHKQRSIRELERRIEAVTQVLKMSKTSPHLGVHGTLDLEVGDAFSSDERSSAGSVGPLGSLGHSPEPYSATGTDGQL